MNKIMNQFPALLLMVTLFINGGCGSSSTETKNKNTSLVSVTIGSRAKAAALTPVPPTDVSSVRIVVSAADMATISRTIKVTAGQQVIDSFEVPNGTGRLFKADALGSGGVSLYSSQVTRDLNGTPLEIPFTMSLTLVVPSGGGPIVTPPVRSGGGTTAFCDYGSSVPICYGYSNIPSGSNFSCPAPLQTVTSCSTSNLLGVCTLNNLSNSIIGKIYWYQDGNTTASSVQQACTASGMSWSVN